MDAATIAGSLGLAAALTSSIGPGVLMRPARDLLAATRAPQAAWQGHVECVAIRSGGGCVGLAVRPSTDAEVRGEQTPLPAGLDPREAELYRALGLDDDLQEAVRDSLEREVRDLLDRGAS